MMRQRGRGDRKAQRNLSRRQSVRAFRDHQAERRQAMLLRERGEGFNGAANLHIFILVEMSKSSQSQRAGTLGGGVCDA